MKIVNLTPHVLKIYNTAGHLIMEVEPSGHVARVEMTRSIIHWANAIPFFYTEYGEPEGLPAPEPQTIYVVSGTFRASFDRDDLYQPGELIRDKAGRVKGCVGLTR